MDAVRESWTDARLDDGFNRVNEEFGRVNETLRLLHEDIRALREETNRRFERVEGRIDDLHKTIHRTMLQLGAGVIVTLVVVFASLIATQL